MVGLDYGDPHLNLYEEFQQWKRHPWITRLLEGGTCLQVLSRAGCTAAGGSCGAPAAMVAVWVARGPARSHTPPPNLLYCSTARGR